MNKHKQGQAPDGDGLFYQVPQALAARADLTATAKLIRGVIAWRIGNNGTAWPGFRRLARDTGTTRNTAANAVAELAQAGLVIVEKRAFGQSNRYTLAGQTVPKTGTVAESPGTGNRPNSWAGGGAKTGTLPSQKSRHNQIDTLNQKGEAAAPPASDASRKTPKADGTGNGAAGRLTAAWARGWAGLGIPFRNRDRVGGILAGMIGKGWAEAELTAGIAGWFAKPRPKPGIGMFKTCLEDGDADLTGRAGAAGAAVHPWEVERKRLEQGNAGTSPPA